MTYRFYSSETERTPGVPLGGILESTYLPSDHLAKAGVRMVWEYTTKVGTVILYGNERCQWLRDDDKAVTDVALHCLNQNRPNWAWWAAQGFTTEHGSLPIFDEAAP